VGATGDRFHFVAWKPVLLVAVERVGNHLFYLFSPQQQEFLSKQRSFVHTERHIQKQKALLVARFTVN
jgi:hypothetical protein